MNIFKIYILERRFPNLGREFKMFWAKTIRVKLGHLKESGETSKTFWLLYPPVSMIVMDFLFVFAGQHPERHGEMIFLSFSNLYQLTIFNVHNFSYKAFFVCVAFL